MRKKKTPKTKGKQQEKEKKAYNVVSEKQALAPILESLANTVRWKILNMLTCLLSMNEPSLLGLLTLLWVRGLRAGMHVHKHLAARQVCGGEA